MPAVEPVPTIGSFGLNLNLDIRQGADFLSPNIQVVNNGSPVDLTGATLSGHIIKRPGDTGTPVPLVVTVIGSPSNGIFTLSLSATVTAAIRAGMSEYDPSSRYVYNVDMLTSAGHVVPLLYGDAIVLRDV